jgi:DNA-binding PadR family transcriptional regulator
MSVRHSLLAILTVGPCYGYQLRAEYARRTGESRTLNVGQIYNTLERLERDGLVATGATDAQGHVYYGITDAGRGEVARWLAAPSDDLDLGELAAKVALAATLADADAMGVVDAERSSVRMRLTALDDAPDPGSATGPAATGQGEGFARAVAHAAASVSLHARLEWLDGVDDLLRQHPPSALPLAPSRPRRGRPARAA